jgi:hypothetical protein
VRSGAVGALTNPRHDDYMNEQALDMSEHSVEGRVIPRRTALLAGVAATCLVAVFSAPLRAQSSYCNGAEPALAPSRDLYCIELVPAAGIRAGAGRVELGRSPGPFTVDVTADGHLRYTPAFTLSDLAPASAMRPTRRTSYSDRVPTQARGRST